MNVVTETARYELDAPASPPRERIVVAGDGVKLSVWDTGAAGCERTVLFLHGLCLTRASWTRQVQQLRRRFGHRVRVISYDHRGHGRSQNAPVGTYCVDRLGLDLAHVLDSLDVGGPVTLVGHSMGGMAALSYLGLPVASRPVDPRGLVLVATAAGRLGQCGLGRLLDTPAAPMVCSVLSRAPRHALRAALGPLGIALTRYGSQAAPMVMAGLAAQALLTTTGPAVAGFLSSLRVFDRTEILPAIRARTVVVSGGVDPLTPAVHARALAAAIPSAHHVHLPLAGHMIPQQAPKVVHTAICQTVAL